ncbi:MAG TPA: glycosyltransferase [Acidimicrobiia bacterium]|nr:glycosyltransferase [Acidimicrobiia bacterium]
MPIRRVAMLSVHTSPLAQPGSGDGGGMNVYVRSLASALARAGVECDVLTRLDHPRRAPIAELEPGVRVVHLEAGPAAPLAKADLFPLLDDLVGAARAHLCAPERAVDALHAHYWLSGAVGHRLKHELELPLVSTFHTLAHTKAAAGIVDDGPERARSEAETVACTDRLIASTPDERRDLVTAYGADPERIEVIPPGVDHAMFYPGDAAAARRHLRLPLDRPVLLFVGRIQPLKGVDLAIRALASLTDDTALLVIVGGPSGVAGDAEVARLRGLASDLHVESRVRWEPPQPHGALADWYRAADVCLVPSRTESFGLVALEAAACGTPVVAANVGGLRSLVEHLHTGFLVDGRTGHDFAAPVEALLADPRLAADMAFAAAAASGRYTWSMTAARLRRLYADVGARELVRCT